MIGATTGAGVWFLLVGVVLLSDTSCKNTSRGGERSVLSALLFCWRLLYAAVSPVFPYTPSYICMYVHYSYVNVAFVVNAGFKNCCLYA